MSAAIIRPPEPAKRYEAEDFATRKGTRRRGVLRLIGKIAKLMSKDDYRAFMDAYWCGAYHLVSMSPAPGYCDKFTRDRIKSIQMQAWRDGAKAWGQYRNDVDAFHNGERECPQKPTNPYEESPDA